MKAILTEGIGAPEILKMKDIPDPAPGAGEVVIRVRAAGLNNADLLQRRGLYPPPPGESEILGLEVAGEILETGPGVTRWKKGDAVMALLGGGGYAERVRLAETQLMAVPPGVDLIAAAGIPEAFLTAYLELVTLGRLRAGESLLIHAGASGVGTAAIQIGRALGARVFVTAGSNEKIRRCVELGAEAGFNYKTESFDERVRDATKGAGVNCVLDLVGAAHWEKNIQALALDGRLLLVGLSGGAKAEISLSPILAKRLQIIGSTLRGRSTNEKARLIREFSAFADPLFSSGRLKPVIDRVFPWDQVQEAHRYLEGKINFGKVILALP